MLSFTEGVKTPIKLEAGRIYCTVTVLKDGKRLWLNFPYNKIILAEVKEMEGAKWHGFDEPNPVKMWTVTDSLRNRFQFEFLMGNDPYKRFNFDHKKFPLRTNRKLFAHQFETVQFGLSRNYGIFAEEMGCGKSLAAIEIMEGSGHDNWWWVAPKAGINSVKLELAKWKCHHTPELHTYDSLKKILMHWPEGQPPPQGVFFDECQKLKTPTSQRTQAAMHLSNAIRDHWGDNGYVLLMSGTPAPKSPADWWSLCEVTYPGFIKEGTSQKFVKRLAVVKAEGSIAGGQYSKIVAWKDSERRCAECGLMDDKHDLEVHPFVPCVNEVAKLYKRMQGLVLVKFKKDCLDLPDKHYRQEKCRPTIAIANAAKMIQATSPSAIDRLIRLRELSDGFQYEEVVDGKEPCQTCKGERYVGTEGLDACAMCAGTGEQVKYKRITREVGTPKDEKLIELLEEFTDVGRLVCYASFTATVDKIVHLATMSGWNVIRVDGRGWKMFNSTAPGTAIPAIPYTDQLDMLKEFQAPVDHLIEQKFDQILFVGHPASAGVGLTLTASPAVIYYSNGFSGEDRIQSEDRIHRPGMDLNRGATIIDILHLPTDKFILENLQKKRDLQNITMGELDDALQSTDFVIRET